MIKISTNFNFLKVTNNIYLEKRYLEKQFKKNVFPYSCINAYIYCNDLSIYLPI